MPPIARTDGATRVLTDVARTIERHAMLPRGAHVLVAVSGGADSVALLHVLRELAPRFDIALAVAHLNHGLRGNAAAEDAEFVARLASRLGLACHSGFADAAALQHAQRFSPEDAARRVRYDFLTATARTCGAGRVALGHTADDNAELVLMRLLQGSGPRGLAGMPPVRSDFFIRPLIDTHRATLIAYLNQHGVSWVEDPTNRDPRFLRNRVRHTLLPLLVRQFTPAAVQLLNRTATIARDEEAWLESLVASYFKEAVVEHTGQSLAMSWTILRQHPPALQRRLIRHAFMMLGCAGSRLECQQVEAIRDMVKAATGYSQRHLPGRIVVSKDDQQLVFERRPARRDGRPDRADLKPVSEPPLVIAAPGRYLLSSEGPCLLLEEIDAGASQRLQGAGQQEALFDMDTVRFPLILRHCRAGDRFWPLGASGHQHVQKYLSDHHVPLRLRDRSWVLLSQERIIWLIGHRLDEAARLRSDTRRVLRACWQASL